MDSKKLIYSFILCPIFILASQETNLHEKLFSTKNERSSPKLSCEILMKFSQSLAKPQNCIKELSTKFAKSNELVTLLESNNETKIDIDEDFFDKCFEKQKSAFNQEQKNEIILSFYLNSYILRHEIKRKIQNISEFARLQGNTSFFKNPPLLSNNFQSEQLQKIKKLASCPPNDSLSLEITHEINTVLLALKDERPIPQEVLNLYPFLNEESFKEIIKTPKINLQKTEQTFLNYMASQEKVSHEEFSQKQIQIQCLFEETKSRECHKNKAIKNFSEDHLNSFTKFLKTLDTLSSCTKIKNDKKKDICLEKKPAEPKTSDCDISFLSPQEKDYRLCKVTNILKDKKLPEITNFEVDSFDKNILNKKKSIMSQRWSNLLFLHYKVDPSELQKLIPPPLELDLHNNEAWVSVVPFKMSSIKPGNITNLVPSFPEINLRTYVKYGEQRGVYFLTLDASNKLVVKTSSLFPGLPYKQAKMKMSGEGTQENPFYFKSQRTEIDSPLAEFEASFQVSDKEAPSANDDLSKFLVERYRFFGVNKEGTVIKTDINHKNWPIKKATVDLKKNTMIDSFKEIKVLGQTPIVQYVEEMDVDIWAPKEVGNERLK
jgi:uncharacterized protein YqjF (DUF2071 family)